MGREFLAVLGVIVVLRLVSLRVLLPPVPLSFSPELALAFSSASSSECSSWRWELKEVAELLQNLSMAPRGSGFASR